MRDEDKREGEGAIADLRRRGGWSVGTVGGGVGDEAQKGTPATPPSSAPPLPPTRKFNPEARFVSHLASAQRHGTNPHEDAATHVHAVLEGGRGRQREGEHLSSSVKGGGGVAPLGG